MPNQPRPSNPARPVRVEDDLWTAAGEACDELGTDRSAVMRDALCKAVRQARHKQTKPQGAPDE